MPGNGLALTVRVGCEYDFGRTARFLANAIQNLAAAADGDIARFKVLIDIHAHLLDGFCGAVIHFLIVESVQTLAEHF